MLIVAAVVVLAGLAALAIRFPLSRLASTRPQVGNLTINTGSVASQVLVDGVGRGTTPLTLSLAAGAHRVVVRSGSDERVVPLTIAAGADVTHNFEMKAAAEPVALMGRMSVATDPSGARVAVDGKPRGISPLVVADLTAAEHKVTVTNETGSADRTVMVTPGGTASVVFSLTRVAGPVGGWLSIATPFDIEVSENEDVIGSSGASRIMLASGRHVITLSNRTLGFQDTRRIDVVAGKTTAVRVDPPKVAVSVNARPWADITLDGNNVGQTPIANLPVSIGLHEMVFRHPELGERKQTVTVSVKGPNRIAMDLSK
jgi:serine/threonine-protein kinase